MGKFRGHQDKSRRGREKKHKKKTVGKMAVGTSHNDGGGNNGRGQEDSRDGSKRKIAPQKRKTKHVTYEKDQSVLICGDGDFSFTRGVIRHRGTGVGVAATSLDSRKAVLKKYPRAENWLPKLHADGAQVVHSVDATRLEQTLFGDTPGSTGDDTGIKQATEQPSTGEPSEQSTKESKQQPTQGTEEKIEGKRRVLFDRVVFNFPHTGMQRTHLNRNLIRDFFASTKGLVKCAAAGGQVHVTLKDKPPYSGWNVKAMAKESDLVMVQSLAFDPSVFPGYRHSTTDPQAKEFDATGARTHVFCRARSALDDDVDQSSAFPVISRPTASGTETEAIGVVSNDCNKSESNGKISNGHDDVSGNGHNSAHSDEDVLLGAEDVLLDDEDSPVEHDALQSDNEDSAGPDLLAGAGNARTSDRVSDESSKRKRGNMRKDRKNNKRNDETAGVEKGIISGKVAGEKPKKDGENSSNVDGSGVGRDDANTAGEGNGDLRPPLVKKKAAKRRAQRKRAAEAAKAALAETSGVNSEGGSDTKSPEPGRVQKSPVGSGKSNTKRKRGKYVVRKDSEGARGGRSFGGGFKRGRTERL